MIPFRFTGKELDEETNLYYMSARYFSPKTGVWLSADPMGGELINPNRQGFKFTESHHWYSYVDNNPVKYTDPTGRLAANAVGAGIGAAAGFFTNLIFGIAQHKSIGDIGIDVLTGTIGGGITGFLAPTIGLPGAAAIGNSLDSFFNVLLKGGSIVDALISGGINGAVGFSVGLVAGGGIGDELSYNLWSAMDTLLCDVLDDLGIQIGATVITDQIIAVIIEAIGNSTEPEIQKLYKGLLEQQQNTNTNSNDQANIKPFGPMPEETKVKPDFQIPLKKPDDTK